MRSRRASGTLLREQPADRARAARATAGARPAASTSSMRRPSFSPPAAAASRSRRSAASSRRTIPNATGEVTRIALGLGAESRDLDELQYHPNGGAWPETMQGYSIPETTRAYGAVLLNADGEEFTDSLGPRDVVSQAIFDEVAKGKGVETEDGRPAVYLDTTRISQADAEVSLPYMLRRYRGAGHRPAARRRSHLPRPPLPERRPHDRHRLADDARGALRLRRDRRRHARPQPHDGQLPSGMLCVRPARRQGRRRESERMSTVTDHRSPARRRGRRGAPLRLGAEGHSAGPPRRARRRARRARPRSPGSACSRRSTGTSTSPTTRRTSSARTRASPSTPAASASTSRSTRPGSTRRFATAPPARPSSTRSARTRCTRSRARTPARTSATGCRSCTGSSSPTGTASTSSACRRAPAPRT